MALSLGDKEGRRKEGRVGAGVGLALLLLARGEELQMGGGGGNWGEGAAAAPSLARRGAVCVWGGLE